MSDGFVGAGDRVMTGPMQTALSSLASPMCSSCMGVGGGGTEAGVKEVK